LIGDRDQAPPDKKAWLEMAAGVIARTGFPADLNQEELARACVFRAPITAQNSGTA
jgi:hypothetical protein